MTKDEVFAVVLEAQAMSDKDKQRAQEMVERLSDRFPDFKTHNKSAVAAAIYGLALSKVPIPTPRKRYKKQVNDITGNVVQKWSDVDVSLNAAAK